MPEVPRELIEHELHVNPKAKPIMQQLRRFTQDKKDVTEREREIARLLDAGFINEVYHPVGSPIPFVYLKGIKIGGCVLIIMILIRHTKKICLVYPTSIRLWTLWPATTF
jgi:hypothetical protein